MGLVVPTIVNMLISRPHDVTGKDLPQLRFLTSSSAPLLHPPKSLPRTTSGYSDGTDPSSVTSPSWSGSTPAWASESSTMLLI